MRRHVAISVVAGLLALYVLAGVHQFLPHHAEHGSGDSCALCVLLAAPAVLTAVCAVKVVPIRASVPVSLVVSVAVSSHRVVVLLRGPPVI